MGKISKKKKKSPSFWTFFRLYNGVFSVAGDLDDLIFQDTWFASER